MDGVSPLFLIWVHIRFFFGIFGSMTFLYSVLFVLSSRSKVHKKGKLPIVIVIGLRIRHCVDSGIFSDIVGRKFVVTGPLITLRMNFLLNQYCFDGIKTDLLRDHIR